MQIEFTSEQIQNLSDVAGFAVKSAYIMEDDLYLRGENHLAMGSIYINFVSHTWGIRIFEIDHQDVNLHRDFHF